MAEVSACAFCRNTIGPAEKVAAVRMLDGSQGLVGSGHSTCVTRVARCQECKVVFDKGAPDCVQITNNGKPAGWFCSVRCSHDSYACKDDEE